MWLAVSNSTVAQIHAEPPKIDERPHYMAVTCLLLLLFFFLLF